MFRHTPPSVLIFWSFFLGISISACSTAPYQVASGNAFPTEERVVVQQDGDIRVSAAVPGKEEAEEIFGIPLYESGIQPVWLEIENGLEQRVRFAPYSVDNNYFSPHEVAYMHREGFSEAARGEMDRRFQEMSMPRQTLPGATASGYVFTHAAPGTKMFNVDVFSAGNARSYHFTFFMDVPGFIPDYAEIDFRQLYAAEDVRDFDIPGFRAALKKLPCCATDRTGGQQGLPLNVVIVSEGPELLQVLLRADWIETGSKKEESYLTSAQHLFGRPPDTTLRNQRQSGQDRTQLNLWLAPMRVEGTPVWIGQVGNAIGKRSEFEQFSDFLKGAYFDPDIDDSRNFLLQNVWYAQGLAQSAWSDSGEAMPINDPGADFNGHEYFTDGIRAVMWISGDATSLIDMTDLRWDSLAER